MISCKYLLSFPWSGGNEPAEEDKDGWEVWMFPDFRFSDVNQQQNKGRKFIFMRILPMYAYFLFIFN